MNITTAYEARTRRSAELYREAQSVLPGGIVHDARQFAPHPIYIERADGPRKWDVDGNEYVDYTGGHGALLLGHNHPEVNAAVSEQLTCGTHFGSCHPLEVRWASIVQRLVPSAELVRFTSSGTEATMLAFRLARAATGKPVVVRFDDHFHGWQDHVAFGRPAESSPVTGGGVLGSIVAHTSFNLAGDIDSLRELLESSDDIAAVVLEPTGASWGKVPVLPQFLTQIRELTESLGVLLIFDEVISGFRCSPGGAQGVFGIRPDLTTFAKILAGGFNGGAVAGRREIMERLDSAAARRGGFEKVMHYGTFNANPVSAAAGIKTLEILEETGACETANQYAASLRSRLTEVVEGERLNWIIYGSFSGFHLYTNPGNERLSADDVMAGRVDHRLLKSGNGPELILKLRQAMLLNGVDLFAWPGGPTSAVHGPHELEQTADALRESIRLLRADGVV